MTRHPIRGSALVIACAIVSSIATMAATAPSRHASGSIHEPRQDPTPTSVPGVPPYPTAAPTSVPPTSEPEALAFLRRSDAAMNQLQSLQVETIVGEPSDVWGRLEIQYRAPDRVRGTHFERWYSDEEPYHAWVHIGPHRWDRHADEEWSHRIGQAFRWPRYHRADPWVFPPTSVRFDGMEPVDGRPARRLRYERGIDGEEDRFTEFWTEWIDPDSARLLRSEVFDDDAWGSPGIVTTHRYLAFDEALEIRPPIAMPTLFLPRLLAWSRTSESIASTRAR